MLRYIEKQYTVIPHYILKYSIFFIQIFMKTSSNNLQYLWRKDFEKMKRHEAKCNLLEDKIVTKFAGIISHNCIDNCKIDVQTDISNCESSDDKYNGVLCPETKLTSEDMERYWKTISHSFLKGRTIPYLALINNAAQLYVEVFL